MKRQVGRAHKLAKGLAEEVMQNEFVTGVGVTRDLGLVVYVTPKPEDWDTFDPQQYGLPTEYEGQKVNYEVCERPILAAGGPDEL